MWQLLLFFSPFPQPNRCFWCHSNKAVFMRILKNIFVGLLPFLLFSCQTEEGLNGLSETYESLLDTWIMVERGYSPGSGYITDPVPAEPAQLISFLPDRRMHSNISGLEEFNYYLLEEDSSSGDVLSFYHLNPVENPSHAQVSSYSVVFEEGLLKLHFRWCIEGCHMGFRPYTQGTDE